MQKLKAVLLDAATLVPSFDGEQLQNNHWDIDIAPLSESVGELLIHARTSQEEIVERCKQADIIITNKVVLDDSVLEKLPQLKMIAVAATGTNNIDLAAAKQRNIAVYNVAGYSTSSVVQLTFTLLLALQSKLTQFQQAMTDPGWANASQFMMLPEAFSECAGKTLGIIGYGTIGQSVADVARAFGMKVLVAQLPNRPAEFFRTPLEEMLPLCDVVSLHCPLTDDTHHLVDQTFLSQMRSNALLINTARGPIIDESALANALRTRSIGGAGLDVLSIEPPKADNPLLADDIPNCLITPHIAWASREARQRLLNGIAQNVVDFQENKKTNRVV